MTTLETMQRAKASSGLWEGGYEIGTRAKPGMMRMSFIISGFIAPNAGGALNAASIAAGPAVGVAILVTLCTDEVIVQSVFSDTETKEVQAVTIYKSAGARLFNGNPLSTRADVAEAFETGASAPAPLPRR